jgi:hypothetical protein
LGKGIVVRDVGWLSKVILSPIKLHANCGTDCEQYHKKQYGIQYICDVSESDFLHAQLHSSHKDDDPTHNDPRNAGQMLRDLVEPNNLEKCKVAICVGITYSRKEYENSHDAGHNIREGGELFQDESSAVDTSKESHTQFPNEECRQNAIQKPCDCTNMYINLYIAWTVLTQNRQNSWVVSKLFSESK